MQRCARIACNCNQPARNALHRKQSDTYNTYIHTLLLLLLLQDRDDLIEVALASAHIPFLLDFQLSTACRGQQCVDGSLLYMITRCGHRQPRAAEILLCAATSHSDRQLGVAHEAD